MIETEHPGCEKWTSNWSLLADIEAEMLEGGTLVGAVYVLHIGASGIYISEYIFHICKEIQKKIYYAKSFILYFSKVHLVDFGEILTFKNS